MAKIKELSLSTINKIAAGEVIERPAFAVKELLENAIDAGATKIKIDVENAGFKKIAMWDNGEGMIKEDLEVCWKPHTTSKLDDNDDLLGIRSFGFRGEALASLAAVSRLTIKSRTQANPIGNSIEINNGEYGGIKPIGMPVGTIITSENLFANIPARKKFLKSPQTELRKIVEIVMSFAIAYPHIAISLTHNKKNIIDFSTQATLTQRIEKMMGKEIPSFFLPISSTDSQIAISGFIAKPQMHSSTQSKQLIFVNKRKVSDKLISLAMKEAFGTMLEPTSYPIGVIFVDIPYEMVDINVHPRKEQVSFFNHQTVFQTIKETILVTLQSNNVTFQNLSWKRTGVGTTHSFAGKLLKQNILDKEVLIHNPELSLMQINHLYIVSQTKKGIILTDQHAAHERILFEKLSKEFLHKKRKHETIQLKFPIVLHFSQTDTLVLIENMRLFKNLGFTISTVQEKPVITHIPHLFQDREPQEMIRAIIENLEQGLSPKQMDKVSEEMIAFLACRAAVKAGDSLKDMQMRKILDELPTVLNNATCPHGRPTQILLSLSEINSLFKR